MTWIAVIDRAEFDRRMDELREAGERLAEAQAQYDVGEPDGAFQRAELEPDELWREIVAWRDETAEFLRRALRGEPPAAERFEQAFGAGNRVREALDVLASIREHVAEL